MTKKDDDFNRILEQADLEREREDGSRSLAEEPVRPRFRFKKIGELELRPITWRIEGMMEDNSMAALFGGTGEGKTFVGMDIGCCVASGEDYHGHKSKQGPVGCIIGEGYNGAIRRVEGWCVRNGIEREDLPFFVSTIRSAPRRPQG